MINDLIKRLRKAADALDALQEAFPENNTKVRGKLEKKFEENMLKSFNDGFNSKVIQKRKYKKRKKMSSKTRRLLSLAAKERWRKAKANKENKI